MANVDGMTQLLYQAYIAQGGKLSLDAWLKSGKPQAGQKPAPSTVSGATTPTTTPKTPNNKWTPSLDPDFVAWLKGAYEDTPDLQKLLQLSIYDPQLKPYLDYYNQNVKGKSNGQVAGGQAPANGQGLITHKSDYGGRVLIGSDGKYYSPNDRTVEMSTSEVYAAYNEWIKELNAKGIGVNGQPPPSTPNPNAMNDYQQESLALQRRQFEWQVQQAEQEKWRQQQEAQNKAWQAQYNLQSEASQSAIQKQQNEMELIKGRAFPLGDELGRRVQGAKDMSGAFEQARQSILSSLTQPSDWIKRWEVQNSPNPFTAQTQATPLEQKSNEFNQTSTRAGMFDQMANEAEKLVAQLSSNQDYGAGTPNEATVLTQARNDSVMYRQAAEAERGKLGAYQADLDYLNAQPQPVASAPASRGNAPAPSWLPMFAPGQRSGQAISKEDIATPSAQQWQASPWSVQQGLQGYVDWAGGRSMADILGNMAQMLPNNPGGGRRWSPYIGR